MHHFAIAVCAGIVATVVVGGTALTPTPAEAAKTPSPEAPAPGGDRYMQGGGQGEEDQLACEPGCISAVWT